MGSLHVGECSVYTILVITDNVNKIREGKVQSTKTISQ